MLVQPYVYKSIFGHPERLHLLPHVRGGLVHVDDLPALHFMVEKLPEKNDLLVCLLELRIEFPIELERSLSPDYVIFAINLEQQGS